MSERFPIAKEGWPFILSGLAASGLMAALHLTWPAGAALALTALVLWFFRDPARSVPADEDCLVSPADGKVVELSPLPDGGTKVSIFLSIFDVHVNRAPVTGKVESVERRRGKFLVAWDPAASEQNKQVEVVLKHQRGTVRVVQITGIIARRIVCRLAPGRHVLRGERYGLIRFGSRVDIYLPPEASADGILGTKVKGGRDVIGRWK